MFIPARPDAPVACDMTGAVDTPSDRLDEYLALPFESRERQPGEVVLRFRGAREQIEDLARREAACCPFLSYRVEEDTVWTISGEASEVLDLWYDLYGEQTVGPSVKSRVAAWFARDAQRDLTPGGRPA
jgi:hypothetical protein